MVFLLPYNIPIYLLVIYTLRTDLTSMCLFLNPITILILLYGYNDIVPVYFLILGILNNNKISAYIGCAVKQFNFPIMCLVWLYKKDYKSILTAFLLILLVSLPFIIWDYQGFINAIIFNYFEKFNDFRIGKALYPNYLLYPITLLSIYYRRLGFILSRLKPSKSQLKT